MSFFIRTLRASAIGLLATVTVSTTAFAATVGSAATGSFSVGGFVMNGGEAMVDVSHSAYTNDPTDPASSWVWDTTASQSVKTTNTFVWTFDLTGFDATTAAISGVWGVDNYGFVELNGFTIGSIDFGVSAFSTMHDVADGSATPAFSDGMNTLTFFATNGYPNKDLNPGPGAFRASVTVTADTLSPVPLPAAGWLLLGGLGGLVALRRTA